MAGAQTLVIAPSILAADISKLREEVVAIEKAGADWVHVDVMDGHFVPNLTFGPHVVSALKGITSLPLDVHLMIEKPELSIDQYIKAGADWLTVHAEACTHLDRTLQAIKESGVKAGVSLNPHTSPEILSYVLDKIDLALVMSVNPGFGGQSFLPASLQKIAKIRQLIDASGYDIRLEVDGGIGPPNADAVCSGGADTLVAGSAVFKSANYAEAITQIRQAAGAK